MPDWSAVEIAVFGVMSLSVLVLAWLYCFRMDRLPGFDETGLHNPIYTYLADGKMTYPVHGYPDAMFVHPPTHYFVTAEIMKWTHLDLFDASALPVFFFTGVAILALFSGKFSFPIAISAALALFCGLYIWSDFGTVRPDVHLSAAWFAGLVLLQGAKNWGWSHTRLFFGSLTSVYAATLHYWGVVALLAVGVYAVWFLATTPRSRWWRGLEVMTAGGLLAGGLYLTTFLIPEYHEIRTITSYQGTQGSLQETFNRHLTSYSAFATRLQPNALVPHLLDANAAQFTPRWLVDLLLRPILENRIPAIFLFVPLLLVWKQTRAIALAGAILPLFVLVYVFAKHVGGTGYYTPEIILYIFGIFALLFCGLHAFLTRFAPLHLQQPVMLCVVLVLSLVALREVPVTMGSRYRFRSTIDTLEINRAAGHDLLGDNAITATTSVVNWYVAGGDADWYAYGELYGAERQGRDWKSILAPADAVVEQIGNWWIAVPEGAPLKLWYARGDLNLTGFLLNEGGWAYMDQLYYTPKPVTDQPRGFIIGHSGTLDRFTPSSAGTFVVATLICPSPPAVRPLGLRLFNYFPVATQAGLPGDQMVVLAGERDKAEAAIASMTACKMRDVIPGKLESLDRTRFREDFLARDKKMKFAVPREKAEEVRLQLRPVNQSGRANLGPSPGTVLDGPKVTFRRGVAPGATGYRLWVGTTPGASDIRQEEMPQTTLAVKDIPLDGSPVYVRLFTTFASDSAYDDYIFVTRNLSESKARLLSPANGSTLSGPTATFTRSDGHGVQYSLWVSTVPNTYNILAAWMNSSPSVTVNNLPMDGKPIYVRVWTDFGGATGFQYYEYVFISGP